MVAGTTSTNGLNQNGNGHLSRWSLTHSDSDAKLSNNTALAKIKIQNVKNEGIFARINENDDSNSIVRKLSDRFGLMRSKSSQSFYQNYKIDVFEDELLINGNKVKFRLSTHPANGDRFAQDNFFDERISVVVFKDGEHCGTDHERFTEFVYEPSKMTNLLICFQQYLLIANNATNKQYNKQNHCITILPLCLALDNSFSNLTPRAFIVKTAVSAS